MTENHNQPEKSVNSDDHVNVHAKTGESNSNDKNTKKNPSSDVNTQLFEDIKNDSKKQLQYLEDIKKTLQQSTKINKDINLTVYEEKINNEEKNLNDLQKILNNVFSLMICVSFLCVVYLYTHDINKIIENSTLFFVACLVIYLPLLLMTYSIGKAITLRKYLIEEYTHKHAVHTNFDALLDRINVVQSDNTDIQPLRQKLITNLFTANMKNPSTAIKDSDAENN